MPNFEKDPQPKKEFDLGEKFKDSGGEILEFYSDGCPRRWKCGVTPSGEVVDPNGAGKEALHYINEKNDWMGGNPDEELLRELKQWRSDHIDVGNK